VGRFALAIIVLYLAVLSAPQAAAAREFGGETAVHAFLRDRLVGAGETHTKIATAFVDLDGDGRLDALAYVISPNWCGSGGCSLYILHNEGAAYRLVTRTTVTRPPIRVLQGRTHGWRDVGVWVSGDGAASGYEAVLRFDGRRYPGNPTIQAKAPVGAAGSTVIAEDAKSLPL
jgi:hypothetical protein